MTTTGGAAAAGGATNGAGGRRVDWTPYLAAGEQVVWTGRAFRGLSMTPGDLAFSLLAAGALALMIAGPQPDPTWSVVTSPAARALAGLGLGYFALGRPMTGVLRRRRMAFALTDRRALKLSGWGGRRFQALELTARTRIVLAARPVFPLRRRDVRFDGGAMVFERVADAVAVSHLARYVAEDDPPLGDDGSA